MSGLVRTGLTSRPGKILCVGRNYAAHAKEMDNEVPERPLFFLKPTTAIIGDGETIVLPEQSAQVEHEAEILKPQLRYQARCFRGEALTRMTAPYPEAKTCPFVFADEVRS